MRTDYLAGKPWGIRDILREKRRKETISALVESYRPALQKPRFAVVKKTPEGHHVVGLGAKPFSWGETKLLAKTKGFTHIRMGGVKTSL